jgi:hypothetical protein
VLGYPADVNIFTKRNALVGYIVLQALQRRKWQRRQHALKIAGLVALGIVSAGILAGLAAVIVRRQREGGLETEADQAAAWSSTELDAEFHEPSFTS